MTLYKVYTYALNNAKAEKNEYRLMQDRNVLLNFAPIMRARKLHACKGSWYMHGIRYGTRPGAARRGKHELIT